MRKTGEKLQKMITVLIIWGLLLSSFVAYEIYFVSSQEVFLKERAFHSLERLSREVDAQVQRARISTKSYVQLASGHQLSHEKLAEFLNLYLKGAWDHITEKQATEASIGAAEQCLLTDGWPNALQSTPNGLAVTFSCSKNKSIYTLNLAPWMKSAFQPLGRDFDDVLIADATGDVLFQKSSDVPGIKDLKPLVLQSESDPTQKASESSDGNKAAEATKDSSKGAGQKSEAGSGPAPDPGTKRFETLTDAGFFKHTTLAGVGYELFSVPVRISLDDALPGKSWSLMVCGLRRTGSFEADSRAVPYSTLIWATLIGLAVFSLSWPFAKLRYMSNTERFTRREGWLLVLTIFIAATSVTLMLLNASYTSQTQSEADGDLKKLAGQIKSNFATEMTRANRQMRQLDPGKEKNILNPDYLGGGRQRLDIYPFFEIAFWMDQTGEQLRKLDLRPAPTPVINLAKHAYFTRAVSDEKWPTISASGTNNTNTGNILDLDRYYLDPEISITTAEFSPVLAAPFTSPGNVTVQALSVRPMSLVEPVLPPGYGFAVIDGDCNVLFHSEVFRNERENFCQESKGTAELRPWLFGESDSPVDISYAGSPERAFITSMTPAKTSDGSKMPKFAKGPAYLVVFRIPDYALTLNLAIVLVCAILLGFYFFVSSMIVGVAYISSRVSLPMIDAPLLIWPHAENGLKYVQIFAANTTVLLLYWFFYPRLFEAPLLALSCLVACVCVLLPILKLNCPARVLLRLGLLLIAISVVALAAISATSELTHADYGLSEWWRVLALLGIAGAVAVLLSGALRRGEYLSARIPKLRAGGKRFIETHFAAAYSLAALTVITAGSIVPCLGCFKFAYDAVSEVALKHAEIELSEALLTRRDRIRKYYDELRPMHAGGKAEEENSDANRRIHDTAQSRILQSLDRYDLGFGFCYTFEPKLGLSAATGSATCDPPPSEESDSPDESESFTETINVGVERAIAEAALRFPTNRLGSEMSKLGVASSFGEEHSFTEPEPNRFKLTWKPGSRVPGLTVDARYRTWQGLQWWSGLLLVLWFSLGLWLTRILRSIFLTDVQRLRVSEAVAWKDISEIQGNFLVAGLAKSGKSAWLRSVAGLSPKNCFDLGIELKRIISDSPYRDPAAMGPVVLIDNFEFNLKDRDYNIARLGVLERLVYESDCRIVLVSSIDPLYFLTEGAPEMLSDPKEPELARRLLDRWARVLSKFKRVRVESSGTREFRKKLSDFIRCDETRHQLALWVWRECKATAMLRTIGSGILNDHSESDPVTHQWVESCVLNRAGDYYRVLWSGLTSSERLVLYQLALDGWANPKNTAALQQLESKSLIRRMPMYRIMNESFRCFVACNEHADEIAEWEKQQKQSTWRVLKLVIIGLAVTAAIWLLHSQAALSQELAAYVAGIATLLTAVSALFGRSGKQISAKAE